MFYLDNQNKESNDRFQLGLFIFLRNRKVVRLFMIPSRNLAYGKENDRFLWGELTARTIG